mmetsp:Transcript_130539/g.325671  ORF Transcript_130539/g.325671 Transcript_130539/m.325671 type:complete len:210 (+) Transcript_130539:1219-1848(+)
MCSVPLSSRVSAEHIHLPTRGNHHALLEHLRCKLNVCQFAAGLAHKGHLVVQLVLQGVPLARNLADVVLHHLDLACFAQLRLLRLLLDSGNHVVQLVYLLLASPDGLRCCLHFFRDSFLGVGHLFLPALVLLGLCLQILLPRTFQLFHLLRELTRRHVAPRCCRGTGRTRRASLPGRGGSASETGRCRGHGCHGMPSGKQARPAVVRVA